MIDKILNWFSASNTLTFMCVGWFFVALFTVNEAHDKAMLMFAVYFTGRLIVDSLRDNGERSV
jgi:hypothetical protein